jgi:phosphomannomutase
LSQSTSADRSADLLSAARDWMAEDPDPATRAELSDLLSAVESGDEAARASLADRFAGRLQFGTAGLRGEMGAGPNRMNRITVIRAAAGLAAFLTERHGPGAVVAIGYDARHNSRRFAEDTAEVMAGAGHRPMMLPRALPTPLLAFSVRHLGAQAGVMVTASHNPAQDNGYKVYLDDGSQIAPPNDALIAAKIDAVGALADVPRGEIGSPLSESVVEAYLARAVELVDGSTAIRDVNIVHTAMHGVGWETFHKTFVRAGFPEPRFVAEQASPDPDFPTVAFPNPEEAGALDLAMALASAQGPDGVDVIIANDPDADRLAVAVPDGSGGWRQLSGDDIGLLLAQHLAERSPGSDRVFANTVVSSLGLEFIAAQYEGVGYRRTLTGFKWLSKVEGLTYGYEEALGYCCDPTHVNDKDGITAALLVAELTARLKSEGRTLLDALRDIDAVTGSRVTSQLSIRTHDTARIQEMMRRLRTEPPKTLGRFEVGEAEDLGAYDQKVPLDQGFRLPLREPDPLLDYRNGWVAVRPSGTEPKLKCYFELADASQLREAVVEELGSVKAELAEWFAQFD